MLALGCLSLGSHKLAGYNQDVRSLLEVPVGSQARLERVDGALRAKLRQYGLHIGDCVRVLRLAPIGGPLLIAIDDREIALGRAVAEKIFVEAECESH